MELKCAILNIVTGHYTPELTVLCVTMNRIQLKEVGMSLCTSTAKSFYAGERIPLGKKKPDLTKGGIAQELSVADGQLNRMRELCSTPTGHLVREFSKSKIIFSSRWMVHVFPVGKCRELTTAPVRLETWSP